MSDDGLTFRIAGDEDYPRLGALSVRAYPWSDEGAAPRAERYRWATAQLRAERWVVERAGRHVAQYANLPFTGWVGGVEVPVGGLAGVAVSPEARKSGVARAMILRHLAQLRERDLAWSLLHPFSPGFYAAFGWATASRLLRHRFAPGDLPRLPERATVERIDLADPATAAAVERCYLQFCKRTNGSLSRPAGFLAQKWKGEREVTVAVRDGGEIAGYLLSTLRAPTPRPQTLVCPELVTVDDRAFRALVGFFAAQVDQLSAIEVDTPLIDPFAALIVRGLPVREELELPEGCQPAATLYDGSMARIVDLPRALCGRGYPAGASFRLAFAARDPEIAANQRPLTLTVEDGAPSVSEGHPAGAPILAGPIGAIGQVAIGTVRLGDALRGARLTLDGAGPNEARALDALLALPTPFSLVTF